MYLLKMSSFYLIDVHGRGHPLKVSYNNFSIQSIYLCFKIPFLHKITYRFTCSSNKNSAAAKPHFCCVFLNEAEFEPPTLQLLENQLYHLKHLPVLALASVKVSGCVALAGEHTRATGDTHTAKALSQVI